MVVMDVDGVDCGIFPQSYAFLLVRVIIDDYIHSKER